MKNIELLLGSSNISRKETFIDDSSPLQLSFLVQLVAKESKLDAN